MTLFDKIKYLREQIVETIKYDNNHFKYPLVLLAQMLVWILKLAKKHPTAFNITSQVFRTGWSGSYSFGLREAKYYFLQDRKLGEKIVHNSVEYIVTTPGTAKFFNDPLLMLDGIITVLKNPSDEEKGVLIINYSYYFTLLIKFFDVQKVLSKFHLILEPSWAGLCETNILAYTKYDFPIFLQVYEERDRLFIEQLDSNIIPISVGPSWFINHTNFNAPEPHLLKDIDVIMVAAWAVFKRHRAFFKAVSPLLKENSNLNITLVGYPVDMSKQEILKLAEYYGLENNVHIYEWIKPEEVAALQRRAKSNVLWSKFEGNNRAIIEGMFCGSPVIMREGHNYGEQYEFINEFTGCFANESNLTQRLQQILKSHRKLNPRKYVLENRNCVSATSIMNQTIKDYEKSQGRKWEGELAIKTNELHGMNYFKQNSSDFSESYEWLRSTLSPT
jgi:glycosyltransferase involved in cell wall biosynthesis